MKVFSEREARGASRQEIVEKIKKGFLFVYPTDTVYGIGCNALMGGRVKKIRRLKGTDHLFSVIAPSKQWIAYNLMVRHKEFLKKLPDSYTLIFRKRKKGFLSDCSSTEKLAVRIPKHFFSEIVSQAGVPFVTTSANVSGERTIKRVSDLPASFKKEVDFAIDGGVLDNPPSHIFDLTGEKPKRIR